MSQRYSHVLNQFLRNFSRYVIAPCGFGLLGLSMVFSLIRNLNFPFTSIRLAPSFALSHGYPLYSLPNHPPWVMVGYGPFYPLAYLPCIFAKDPVTAVSTATILAYAYILVPVGLLSALFCQRVARPVNGAKASWVPIFLFFGLLAISVPSLAYITTTVHVDAPTLGSFLLGCYLILRGEEGSSRLSARLTTLAGIAAGLSASCKFTLLAGLLALVLFVLWSSGWKRAARLALSALLTVGLVYCWIIVRDGFPAVALNFQVLGRFPWAMVDQAGQQIATIRTSDKILVMLGLMLAYLKDYAALILGTLALLALSIFQAKPNKTLPANRFIWLFLLIAFTMMPISIASFAKFGGDVNSLALFTLPLILAAIFALWITLHRVNLIGSVAEGALLTSAVLFVALSQQEKLGHLNFGGSIMEESYATVKAYPSQCYFPYDPLAHLLAGDHFRPNMDVIYCYAVGGFPVEKAAFESSMPQGIKYIILPSSMENWGSSELRRLFVVQSEPVSDLKLKYHTAWALSERLF